MKTNHKLTVRLSYLFLLSAVVAAMLTSCGTPKNISYFQDVNEDTILLGGKGDLKIQPGDQLSIVVKTMDPSLSALFNLSIVSDRTGEGNSTTPAPTGISKYTVSDTGTIDLPVIGTIKVAGMTRQELSGFIKGELMGQKLAKDPVVTVEFVNLGVSLLGEVHSPGKYNITKDKMTVLEAISMAGDLKVEGQRENVLVLREEDGKVNTYRLDLTNFKELSQSPAYYLQQGDVVYVEPNDMRKRASTTNGNNVYSTSFWISVASLLTSVVTTIGVFVVK